MGSNRVSQVCPIETESVAKIVNGWLSNARRLESPNCNERPEACSISLLIIHNISLPPGEFGACYIDQLFTNTLSADDNPCFIELCEMNVSAHLLIDRSGEITQYVAFDKRAWHAGSSSFQGRDNCNDFSIGIELEGADHIPYTAEQYRVLAETTRLLMSCFPAITRDRIVGHCDVAPDRKSDPGPAFAWDLYFSQLDHG